MHDVGAKAISVKWVRKDGFGKASTDKITNGKKIMLTGKSQYLAQSGSSISKTAGGNTWNAGAASRLQITGMNMGISFKPTRTDKYYMIGLNKASTDTSFSYTDIDFAMYVHRKAELHVYENGKSRGKKGSYDVGDELQVRINAAGKVEYVKNGLIIYTSTVSPSYPLVMDMSMHDVGSKCTDLKWITKAGFSNTNSKFPNNQAVSWRERSSTLTVSGTSIEKKSGGSSWNAGANGRVYISKKDQGVSFKPTRTDKYYMLGLNNALSQTSKSYTDIDYAMYVHRDAKLYVYENGASRGNIGKYAAGAKLQVRVNSVDKVEYVKNGVVLYTSSVAPKFPLIVDLSMHDVGSKATDVRLITKAGFDLRKEVKNGTPVKFIGASSLLRVSGNSVEKKSGSSKWDAGAASSLYVSGKQMGVSFKPTRTDKYFMVRPFCAAESASLPGSLRCTASMPRAPR
jgi:hypothetical protein